MNAGVFCSRGKDGGGGSRTRQRGLEETVHQFSQGWIVIYRERNLSIVFNYLLDILNIVNTKKLSWPNWSKNVILEH